MKPDCVKGARDRIASAPFGSAVVALRPHRTQARLRDAIGHTAARSDEAAVAEALEQAEAAAIPEYYPSSAAQ